MKRAALALAVVAVMAVAGGADQASPASFRHNATIVAETPAETIARHRLEFRRRVTPFYCSAAEVTFDPGFYAIPCANVDAESGGRGGIYCNTYGIIGGEDEPGASSATWIIYGGTEFAPTACAASEREQSIIAARIYDDVGTAAWTPFE